MRSTSGFTMLAVVFAMSIATFMAVGMNQIITMSLRGMGHVENRRDIRSLQDQIATGVDCAGTLLAGAGTPVSLLDRSSCNTNSSQSGQDSARVFLRLRRKTPDGSVQWLGEDLVDGPNGQKYAKLGDWAIRTTCSYSEQALVVRAAKIQRDGTFQTDPLTKRPLDWQHPRSLIFGKQVGALSLCAASSNKKITAGGRLSLISDTPVTPNDVTSNTVYYSPYSGNEISLYNGGDWVTYTFSELSVSLTGLSAPNNYDVFIHSDGGTPALELGTPWRDNTTRSDAITRQDGTWVKTNDKTRRYLGTLRTTGPGRTSDTKTQRFLYNAMNRVQRNVEYIANRDWRIPSDTNFRPANNSTDYRVEALLGLKEEVVSFHVDAVAIAVTTTGSFGCGLSEDSTTVSQSSGTFTIVGMVGSASSFCTASITKAPEVGYHYYQWIEWGNVPGLQMYVSAFNLNGIRGLLNN